MKLRISDHALVRFQERILGADLGAVRSDFVRRIKTSEAFQTHSPYQIAEIQIEGHTVILHGSTVVTVLPPDDKP